MDYNEDFSCCKHNSDRLENLFYVKNDLDIELYPPGKLVVPLFKTCRHRPPTFLQTPPVLPLITRITNINK